MYIITWNANSTTRWQQLWQEPLVTNWQWDIICLQEVGNPRDDWTPVRGNAWSKNREERDTNESSVRRYYTYQPPGLPAVFILHCEWPNHQKNHLVIITKSLPSGGADISGDQGERPAVAIKVRLTWPDTTTKTILLGCVHIISSYKSPAEVQAMLNKVENAKTLFSADGWLLVGDFNCDATTMKFSAGPSAAVRYPPSWETHKNTPHAIDYLLASSETIFSSFQDAFRRGNANSDHWLVCFHQISGPTVTVV